METYPFLEGRSYRSSRMVGERLEAPRVPDGVIFRILEKLLILDGDRLSYRALDVEQIGSVYEAMMGFSLLVVKGTSIAVGKQHDVVNLDHTLRQGDSLVGLSREQIASFNWEKKAQLPLVRELIDARVREAEELREQIEALAESDDANEKQRLLRDADDALRDVRLVGDALAAAFFGGDSKKAREELRKATMPPPPTVWPHRGQRAFQVNCLSCPRLRFRRSTRVQHRLPETHPRTTPGELGHSVRRQRTNAASSPRAVPMIPRASGTEKVRPGRPLRG